MKIPFNKPFFVGNELKYISSTVKFGKTSGNGIYTKKCEQFFEAKYQFKKTLLTTSCTAALEMAAILINIAPEDEVIMPSFTFVSTANAFVLRGARIIFADSNNENPNINAETIERLITPKTKAIVVVHYAGISCDMDKIMSIATKNNIIVIEDAAQSIDSFYKQKPLGSIGHLATFSFHETKNIISGEGGMLVINDESLIDRAEIIREKGTNRKQFSDGKSNFYTWVDIGSSYIPSEITAAYLYAQLEKIETIQQKRIDLWERYHKALMPLEIASKIKLPTVPKHAKHNGHIFYILCSSSTERNKLIAYLQEQDIMAVFHYMPLHSSPFASTFTNQNKNCTQAEFYGAHLLRLPLFYTLKIKEQDKVIHHLFRFYNQL